MAAGLVPPVVAMLALAMAFAGCGFQLRAGNVSDAFGTVRLEADASVDFARQVGRALRGVGVSLVEGEADVVLKLARQEQVRRTASVAADGRVAEYELALAVEVAAQDRNGAVLIPAGVLRSERVARLARDNLVGSSDEQALLGAQMREELSGRIVRALAAAARSTAATRAEGG